MASNQARTMDPPFSGQFVFTVDGLTIGTFLEVSGLSVQIDTEEVVEGGQNQFTHKLPKQMKWPNLVLKRGITDTDTLFEWFAKCSGDGLESAGNKIERRHGSVQLKDSTGKVVRRWDFTEAFPVKWSGPKLAATSKDLATEELEVCHCGFKPAK
ncbi:phage tail protein [Kibdelosporangium persicum]|uniref:Glycerol acyltransferase n=1 Tax=Kibdelosporangium persicum TaxID=2698649 RepID=A0ABX2EZA7_9PSEU|nr:phage tail protein [Kibdelosporangium persicum]NRN64115.1 Glycerol acyltransferase [Kibdelosporangium persicum]